MGGLFMPRMYRVVGRGLCLRCLIADQGLRVCDSLSLKRHYAIQIGRASCRERVTISEVEEAEDGIRDKLVTGVQTCALPISIQHRWQWSGTGNCTCDCRGPWGDYSCRECTGWWGEDCVYVAL